MENSERGLTIYIDGASRGNPGPAAIGVVIEDSSGAIKARLSRFIGETTNNQAEYQALLAGLKEAAKLRAEHVNIKLDSELVARQIQGEYKVKSANLKPLLGQVTQLLKQFPFFSLEHIPREQNKAADALANQALDKKLKKTPSPSSGAHRVWL